MGYFDKILELGNVIVKRDKERGKPSASIAHVYHEDWCGIFKGKECNCEPEIKLEEI
jgi:hypothetical protein